MKDNTLTTNSIKHVWFALKLWSTLMNLYLMINEPYLDKSVLCFPKIT